MRTTVVIQIKGAITDNNTAAFYQYFKMSVASPKLVADALQEAKGDDVDVEIASNGGDVFAASEIYTALKGYKGKVNVQIQGLAASAASVIAMAGDKVSISPTAQIMIHRAWSNSQGNTDDMQHEAQVLDQIDQSIVSAYEAKTGMDQATLLNLMSEETWLTAKDAVAKGFADEIMFEDTKEPQFMNSISEIPSKEALNKFMNLISQSEPQKTKTETTNSQPAMSLTQSKLAILFGKEVKD